MNRSFLAVGIFLMVLTGMLGCTSTTTIAALEDSVVNAQSTADDAMNLASEVREIAMRAERKADEAMAMARQAQNDANAANERAERMFESSISK